MYGNEIVGATGAGAAVAGQAGAGFAVGDSTRARILDGVPAGTRRAYARQWDRFADWCAERGRLSLPATGRSLAEYVSALCDAELSPATVEQAVAGVRTMHRLTGHAGQPDTHGALTALRVYRRRRAEDGRRNQRQASPVTVEAWRAMVTACDLGTRGGIRDRLLLVLGLALMGRRAELAALTVADVCEAADGLEVTVRTAGTGAHPYGDSCGETIAIPRGSHPLTDPVAAWRGWIAVLTETGHAMRGSGRLLRRVDRHGNLGPGIGPDAINAVVRSLAERAGVPSAGTFTAHSLRAGGATVAYAAGVPIPVIARRGRWDPDSPVLLGCVRAVDHGKDEAVRGVGR